jgi:DNA-binding HxlR family transcriptional regulator
VEYFHFCLHSASGIKWQIGLLHNASRICFDWGQQRMRDARRSGCPINLTLEVLGDSWSLIVIRDVMFGNRRHYGDLLRLSEEGIASNILANRLKRLVRAGLLSRTGDPTHRQKGIYSLTEASIQLVPLLAHMGAWGRRHTQVSKELAVRAQLLEEGGERMWKAFMAELRSIHLGTPLPRRSVIGELQAAFEAAVRQQNNNRRYLSRTRTEHRRRKIPRLGRYKP